MNDRSITSITVFVILATFMFAFGLNALGQWIATKTYQPPDDLVEIIKLVIGASVATLTWAGISGAREAVQRKTDESDKKE